MSFVLEALKKQEADRDPDAAVSLAKAGILHQRHRRWVALFVLAMVANALLVGWLLWGGPGAPRAGDGTTAVAERPPASTDAAASTRPSPMWDAPAVAAEARPAPTTDIPRTESAAAVQSGPVAAANAEPAPPPRAEPRPAQVPPAPVQASQPAPRPATQTPRAEIRTYGLDELTPAERKRFPGIAFSTHIYSEDPTLRAVVANGQRRQEGDRIRGLEILQITRDGVVLAFEDKRVKVPLAVDWDSLE